MGYQAAKGGVKMQVIVIRSPKCLRGILRRLFGIQKEKET